MEKYIEIIDAVKTFGTIEALRGISITVRKGEVVLIIGPSGSGKSTLLRCINRLERLDSGEILIDGESVTDPDADIRHIREKVGMVFQSFNLFPHLTVLDNITLAPINVLKKSKEEA
ncbi:MAG TPA: ATP-binding cassette domain-containing protein, partial [Rectinema sp.]|nr:ATP-binding cassette domain-containing protein [Rectinema sp.]